MFTMRRCLQFITIEHMEFSQILPLKTWAGCHPLITNTILMIMSFLQRDMTRFGKSLKWHRNKSKIEVKHFEGCRIATNTLFYPRTKHYREVRMNKKRV